MSSGTKAIAVTCLVVLSALSLAPNGGCPQPVPDNGVDGDDADMALQLTISGRGEVILTPSGTAYQPDETPMTANYGADQTVSLTASADDGWELCYWTGDLSGNDTSAALTMDADKQVTAVFMPVDICTMLGGVAPPDDGGDEPLETGTWTGYIAAEHIVTAEESGQCPSDDGDSQNTFQFEETESKRAAVSIGPVIDMAWQQTAEGNLEAIMDNSYHTVTTYDSDECCADEPECHVMNTVTPGDVFDYLTTDEAEQTLPLTVDLANLKVDVLLAILPVTSDGADPLADALGMAEWIFPYADETIPVRITVSINPTQDVEFTESTLDKLTDACDGTTNTTTDSGVAGTLDVDMDFEFEGALIKRSSGQHEIVGFYSEDWTEEGTPTPCNSNLERSATENCTVHLIRRP